ncbi:NAD(P)/FAD-dependent oxidoreductase [Streptococcus pluranimalium]|uniref:Baeyer-Villiger flavin-containing monooxygenase n=1 Tax=Streptococcus pluranimalium TaxID=82348 RepID=A0A345VM69_9STRE|nr:NAD(P)/FAD-dependent oxidoreductase [Streptococcus pluranimalium]AXJ13821.1 Baeyer-Villiger flavin-containing monooxygenase [Streptococcus pluranimalium]
MKDYKIIIVGAGAAGIGFGAALQQLGIEDYLILEKGSIGDSFLKWPRTTRFITPSFTTNGFGFPDINAVVPDTSPAFSFQKEHLSGREYAEYLHLVAKHYDLRIETQTEVTSITSSQKGYQIETNRGTYQAKYLIMATGEFQNPYRGNITGSDLAIHYGEVDSFYLQSENHFIVLGGNESGCDAFTSLAAMGNSVSLYTEDFGKSQVAPDPSIRLSPITQEKLAEVDKNKVWDAHIYEEKTVTSIEKESGTYRVHFEDGTYAESQHQPVLATGFRTCILNILGDDLFQFTKDGIPMVNEKDESTLCHNVFLIGPSLRQKDVIFCYIYKFRQRFIPVIKEIAKREKWTLAPVVLDFYKDNQMSLDDLSCCGVRCDC